MKQRVIKFRAMRDDMNPSWVYGSLLYGGDIPRIQELPLFSLFTTCLKGTEGQFTGLKEDEDGRDREVYEGDIILHGSGELRGPGIVKWCEYSLGFKVFRGTNPYHIYRPEIIGNIWENPELLPTNTQDK